MKLKKSILLLTLSLFFSACLPNETELDADTARALSATTIQSAAQDCFDLKMEAWYTAFHYYQANGYDMEAADEKALAIANKECP